MELAYYIFYAVLIWSPLLIGLIAFVLMPVWYLWMAIRLVDRYGTFGWKAIGWSAGALVVGALIKPPVVHTRPTVDLDAITAWTKAAAADTELPALPPPQFDVMNTMFALIVQPPVFLYVAALGSFLAFRWLLRWQPTAPAT